MYKLVIPSFKRHKTLKEKTLNYLSQTNIPSKNIFIYVANEEERIIYKDYLDSNTYADIVVGKRGIPQQRNFIQKTHKIGEHIFMLDDDLKSISTKVNNKKLMQIEDLDDFINHAFNMCNRNKVRYFGTYPVDNPFFMKNNISFDHVSLQTKL